MPSTPQKRRPLAGAAGIALAALVVALAAGCSSGRSAGFYHVVRPGENVYRIGLRYGVPTAVIVRANRIADVTSVRTGTRLWIPAATRSGATGGARAAAPPGRVAPTGLELRAGPNVDFRWPLRGKLTSRFGRRGGRRHDGIDLSARRGSPILAAEAGRVIHSGRLGDYGKVVILKHEGHYRSVYAHASQTLVRKGQFVERGQKIALVGDTGRATGPHLHFEIRERESPRDPMIYLP